MTTIARPQTWSPETLTAAVADAVWAPSIHNSQPWRFRGTEDGVDVLLDEARQLPVSDPDGRLARISCGAAAYNLRLALAVRGQPAWYRLGLGTRLLHLWPGRPQPCTPREHRLHQQIHRRHTNRGPFADSPIDPGLPLRLADAARREGGWLDFVTGDAAIASVAAIVREADARLRVDADYQAELRAWTVGADHRVEGIGPAATGPAPHPGEVLARRDFGGAPHDAIRDRASRPVVAVLGVLGDGPDDAIRAGMALQCVLLTAADLGLATAMYSQPVEVPETRERLRQSVDRLHDPHLVLRFGYAPATCFTNRRPVEDVLEI